MRKCFGQKYLAPHLIEIIKEHMNHLEDLHEADTTVFKDKEYNYIESVLAKVVDLNSLRSIKLILLVKLID